MMIDGQSIGFVLKPTHRKQGNYKMNTSAEKSVLGQLPTVQVVKAASTTSAKNLDLALLAAGVAALVVLADQLIDSWAETHVLAAWLALWVVAVLAIVVLRGVTRLLAQRLMTGLDAWSAGLARRRSDERLWAMAQNDSRLMGDLQSAMDQAEVAGAPVNDLAALMTRRAARVVRNRLYYI